MIDLESFDYLRGIGKDDEIKVQIFKTDELYEFEGHTFKVRMDKSMLELIESIQRKGIMEPVIVRPRVQGGMELISGHRRWTAAKMAGITEIPGIIKNLDDDDAIIFMNDTNLKREYISPMERAFSYKARYEAMDRKQLKLGFKEAGEKMNARAKMAEEVGDSETNIYRYIRLTELVPEFQQLVDDKKIEVYIGADISMLTKENQMSLYGYASDFSFKYDKETVSELKKLEKAGKLNDEKIYEILSDSYNKRLNEKAIKRKYSLKLSTSVIDRIPMNVKDRNAFIEEAVDYYLKHLQKTLDKEKKKGKEKSSP